LDFQLTKILKKTSKINEKEYKVLKMEFKKSRKKNDIEEIAF